jgi:hypothetical protein
MNVGDRVCLGVNKSDVQASRNRTPSENPNHNLWSARSKGDHLDSIHKPER